MDVVNYQCPNCDAPLKFSSKSQQWDCEFCGSSFKLEDLKGQEAKGEGTVTGGEYDAAENEWREDELKGMKVYSCEQCGGEIIADEMTSASFCPYCGNTAIFSKQFEGAYRPESVIPFKMDKKQAKEAYQKFCKGKWLIPRDFTSANKIDEVTGVYVPFWLYDCEADSDITFHATKIKTWRQGDYEYTKTDYYAVRRSGNMAFTQVPADGSTKMDDDLMGALEPFQYQDMTDFSTAYLSGYLAEKYDQGAEDVKPRVDTRMRNSAVGVLQDTVRGYSSVNVAQNVTNLNYGKTRYVLLPVWMLASKYKDKDYMFAMNGQTGKMVGNLPISVPRAVATFFGIMGGTALIGYIGAVILFLLGGM